MTRPNDPPRTDASPTPAALLADELRARPQLSMELEEGRAARMLGVPFSSNPYRTPEAQRMTRWDEAARNWDSGWTAGGAE